MPKAVQAKYSLCPTRTSLAGFLHAATVRLAETSLRIGKLAADGHPLELGQAQWNVQIAKQEWLNIQAELEQHRAEHGC
jgi:hypothetical protein